MASVIRMFARNMATKADIKHVTVIGGGLMGSGIAQVSFIVVYNYFPKILKSKLLVHYFFFNEFNSKSTVYLY